MSFDLALEQTCTHRITEELRYPQGGDVVVPQMPLASDVRVRLNGLLDVPSQGVSIPARVLSVTGPFVSKGVTLLIGIQSIPIPRGSYSADQLLRVLSSVPNATVFFQAKDGRIIIETKEIGPYAKFYLPASSGAMLLGLKPRVYHGSTVAPGWSLVGVPGKLDDRPLRQILFDSPLPAETNFIELDYATTLTECLRCGGVGIEDDFSFSGGKVVTLRDEDLLLQEIRKIILTIRGSNVFHTRYGSKLGTLIGQKNIPSLVKSQITADIQQTLQMWLRLKTAQEAAGQLVTDGEMPVRIVDLQVQDSSPNTIGVDITLESRASTKVSVSRVFSV